MEEPIEKMSIEFKKKIHIESRERMLKLIAILDSTEIGELPADDMATLWCGDVVNAVEHLAISFDESSKSKLELIEI
mgnify:CR=1 FL=1